MLIGLAGFESPRALDSLFGERGDAGAESARFVAERCGVIVSIFSGRLSAPGGEGVGRLEEGESLGEWCAHCDMNERTVGRYVSHFHVKPCGKSDVMKQGRAVSEVARQWRRHVCGWRTGTYRENEA